LDSKENAPMPGPEQKADLMADGLDRIPEAAHFLKVSTTTIYHLMAQGRLPFVKIGKARRIPHQAVVELAATNLVCRTTK
jgi:excisionase family DNA binding protein